MWLSTKVVYSNMYDYKDVIKNLKFKVGDYVAPYNPPNGEILYSDFDYYIVISRYAVYARESFSGERVYESMCVHENKLDYNDIYMFGYWKLRVKNLMTGKYKFFGEEDIIKLEDTYLKLLSGSIREIKINYLFHNNKNNNA